jgi:hypothetical protein
VITSVVDNYFTIPRDSLVLATKVLRRRPLSWADKMLNQTEDWNQLKRLVFEVQAKRLVREIQAISDATNVVAEVARKR